MSLLSPYRTVLRTPHAFGAFVSSLVGRLCYGVVGLSLLLTLTAGGRHYGFAGLVMALFGLTIVLVSPFRAWMVDRHGPRRALPPMAAGFAAILIAIAVISARSGVNDAGIAVLAAAAGACAPPLGVVMRTLWSALVDDRDVLQTAYSLDGVAEELLNVAGPVIAGVIVVAATPAAGLLVTAGLVVAGTGLFVRSPALRRWQTPMAGAASSAPGAAPREAGAGRAILAVAFVTGAVGLCLGGLGLVIVAFSQARHDPAAVAWIEAALSAGSALGGLGYGAVRWRICPQHRLALLAAGLVVVLIPAALSPNLARPGVSHRPGRCAGIPGPGHRLRPHRQPGIAEGTEPCRELGQQRIQRGLLGWGGAVRAAGRPDSAERLPTGASVCGVAGGRAPATGPAHASSGATGRTRRSGGKHLAARSRSGRC